MGLGLVSDFVAQYVDLDQVGGIVQLAVLALLLWFGVGHGTEAIAKLIHKRSTDD